MENRVQFVGARQAGDWFCCSCLDVFFSPWIADRLMVEEVIEQGCVADLEAVYSNDPWVQHQVCYGCRCCYDEEP